jgi:hypothetical protein
MVIELNRHIQRFQDTIYGFFRKLQTENHTFILGVPAEFRKFRGEFRGRVPGVPGVPGTPYLIIDIQLGHDIL